MKQLLTYLWRWTFWNISRVFCFIWLRPKFNMEVRDADQKIPRRPFIMVSNHGTFFDPWIVGHLSSYPLSIMMNEEGFRAPRFTRWYLRNIGAYPKKKGESDIKAMKYTLITLKEGYPVLIFPEGQTTWDGQTQPIYGGIESIISRAKLPLVMMNVSGNFMSRPWWSESFRKGKVIVRRRVLSPQELAAMDRATLRDTIISFIRNNDLFNPELENVVFEGPPATVGLNRFVWMCRSCGAEDGLCPSDDGVACSACGATWKMDSRFRFTPMGDRAAEIGNLHDWSIWHKDMVKKKISRAAQDELLTSSDGVHLCDVTEDGQYPTLAVGRLALTRSQLSFTTDNGDPLILPVEKVNDYVFQLKTIFECRVDGKVYKFRIENGSPMKWVYYFRYLNNYAECEARGYI